MKTLDELKTTPGLCITEELKGIASRAISSQLDIDGIYRGWVEWPGFKGTVIFGFNEGGVMEHVSVSNYNRRKLPTWDDMCKLKDMFFLPEEMVVQIHPAEENYLHGVQMHGAKLENVLHLWRPKNGDFSILNNPEVWQ